MLFGSALSNFGVRQLLDTLIDIAPPPPGRPDADGDERALGTPFSALVFKVQANMDPRHRDRIAFMRICSGRFERGMRAINARTGKPIALTYAHELFGQDRTVVDDAYPGDVIGIVNATDVLVGDTLYLDEPVRFGAIPTLAPEHFVTIHNRDPGAASSFTVVWSSSTRRASCTSCAAATSPRRSSPPSARCSSRSRSIA